MALTVAQIADLVTTTQKHLGKLKWTDIAQELQDYVAMRKLLNKNSVRFDGGESIQINVKYTSNNAARNTGLFDTDSVIIGDTQTTASIPWRFSDTHYAFDRRELSINKGPRRIVNLIQLRRIDGTMSLAKLMEENFWGKPEDSTDERTPYGVEYWIVDNATEGFNGGAPSGFTTVAGLSPTTYPTWKNWTAQYTTVSKTDLIRKMRKATVFTEFKSPVAQPNYASGEARRSIYTCYDVLGTMEELLEEQNDSLGNDLASKDGQVLFRRIPVEWVPFLEDDSADPVIGIDWKTFRPVFLEGEYMREDPPEKSGDHNQMVVWIDCAYNFECVDRRRNWRIDK